jgi:diguanylate cyclase (GGDEF)-like protein
MFNKATDYITEEEHSKVFQRWVSVKFEHGVNYDLIWKWVIGAVLLLSFIALWSWKLSRLNRQLSQEVDLRQQAEQELTQANESLNNKNRELEVLSSTDALTGIANRLQIEKSLDNELSQTNHNQQLLSILLLDIDHFKNINDTYGHPIGDEVLQGVAQILRDNTRERDIVGRWGGEEFLIILPETDLSLALRLAEKLRATLAAEQFPTIDQVTASFGVAEALDDISARHLVQRVDVALYQAKEQGRNRVNTAE